MDARIMDRRCIVCGRMFRVEVRREKDGRHYKRPRRTCSIACAQLARHRDGASEARRAESAHAAFDAEELRIAKARPAWCSPVRWRIELRRRRDPGYFALFGEAVD